MSAKKIGLIIGAGILVVILYLAYRIYPFDLPLPYDLPARSTPVVLDQEPTEVEPLTIVVEGLEVPWSIAFLPNGDFLIAERPGRIRLVTMPDYSLLPEPLAIITEVSQAGEGGLLGLATHPRFRENNWVYAYYTYQNNNSNLVNRVVRFTLEENQLTNQEIILDNIPGAVNHNGGRIAFGPDNMLYIATGDAQVPTLAQDLNSLAGKILRITDQGEMPIDNPFDTLVYSYGHRNPQGLAWDNQGRLWSTEHGRSGIRSGLDELNLIEAGGNYGWPTIEGDAAQAGMISPVIHSGPDVTWAPAGLAYLNGSLYFAGLRGNRLYQYTLSDNNPVLIEHFSSEFGRLREVIAGSNNYLYFSTSNRDGRGRPAVNDDLILRMRVE